jgi:uncharacterized membrane protein
MKRLIARLHLRRYLVAGALMLAPLWVTWLVLDFIFTLLSRTGRPWVYAFTGLIAQVSPATAELLYDSYLEGVLAALLTLVIIYVIGWATSRVLTRQVIAQFEHIVSRIPLVQVIYGSTKKLLAALQTKPQGVQRVVLIDFPAPPLKTVALVTRVVRDTSTGREMAIVYVPTSPNPTSGYMEIVPLDQLVSLDWSLDEAMRFIITGGTSAPSQMDFGSPPDVEIATSRPPRMEP